MTTPTDNREHLHRLLEQFSTAMLVTHAGGGKLRARPMAVAQVEKDCRVWFLTAEESAKAHEIGSDTRVQIICQNDRSAYLSLGGEARLVRDRTKIHELWKEPFRIWFEGKDDPQIVLIEVRPEEGEFWDNEGINKVKFFFAAMKAYAAGEKPDFDEGEQHGQAQFRRA